MKEIYISGDIEAAGSIPGPYSMLSAGACDVERPHLTFYRELKPITSAYELDAIKVAVRGLDVLRDVKELPEYNPDHELFNPSKVMSLLSQYGQDPRKAMNDFGDWVKDIAGGKKPVFLAFNAPYDWSFMNWYLRNFTGTNPFGISALDIKAFYMGKFNTSWQDTTKRKIPNIFKPAGVHTHQALEDAVEQAALFRNIRSASYNFKVK